MGICLSYAGSMDDPSRLEELLNEVRAFCAKAGWPAADWSESYSGILLRTDERPDGTNGPELIEVTHRGLHVSPDDTATLRLQFSPAGQLSNFLELPHQVVINPDPATTYYLSGSNWVKTTGALESHAAICLLLRLLKDKYMSDLEVSDDTGYYASLNFEELRKGHQQMGVFIAAFSKAGRLQALARAAGIDMGGKVTSVETNVKLPVARNPKPARKGPVN